jgi:hypothetical protein
MAANMIPQSNPGRTGVSPALVRRNKRQPADLTIRFLFVDPAADCGSQYSRNMANSLKLIPVFWESGGRQCDLIFNCMELWNFTS